MTEAVYVLGVGQCSKSAGSSISMMRSVQCRVPRLCIRVKSCDCPIFAAIAPRRLTKWSTPSKPPTKRWRRLTLRPLIRGDNQFGDSKIHRRVDAIRKTFALYDASYFVLIGSIILPIIFLLIGSHVTSVPCCT